jgi:hypothetical protein
MQKKPKDSNSVRHKGSANIELDSMTRTSILPEKSKLMILHRFLALAGKRVLTMAVMTSENSRIKGNQQKVNNPSSLKISRRASFFLLHYLNG